MATYNGHNEDSSGNILLSIGNGMTATVETGTTASQAYTKGSYLFFNNRLCKATSAISSGATLAIGTNLSQTSIGQEITSHLRSSDGKEFYFDVKDGTYGYYPSASKTASEFVPFGGTGGAIVNRTSGGSLAIVNNGQVDGITNDTWVISGFKYIDYTLFAYASDRKVNLYVDGTLVESAQSPSSRTNYEIGTGEHTIGIYAEFPGSVAPRMSGFTPHN